LHDENPDAQLFLLMGADMFHDLPNWHEASRVCTLALPLIVRRPGAGELNLNVLSGILDADRMQEVRSHLVEMPEIGISATDLRRRVAAGKSIRYQTPRAVEAFIQTHNLYKG
jgi:nicotinate-nucleotide adenylyltransferase